MFFYVAKNQKQKEKKGLKRKAKFIFGIILTGMLSFTPKKEVKAEDLNITSDAIDNNLNEIYDSQLELLNKTQESVNNIYNNMLSEETLLNMDYQSQVEYHQNIYNKILSVTNDAMEEATNSFIESSDNLNIDINSLNKDMSINENILQEVAINETLEKSSYEEVKVKEVVEEQKIETTNTKVSLKPVINEVKAENIENQSYNGSVLSPYSGVVNNGPSGKETYYNLKMTRVIETMRKLGFSEVEYPYYEREDGAKCLGPYVMVAANLSLHPRGSFVETTLGTGIVCDTGEFAKKNPNQIDIATNWSKSRTLKKK